jgi:hypothetical protein
LWRAERPRSGVNGILTPEIKNQVRALNIDEGGKQFARSVGGPYVMRGGWWLEMWEGRMARSHRGGGLNPKSRISSRVGSISSRDRNGLWCGWKDPM